MLPPWELVHYTNCILCIKGSAVLSVPVHFCVISFSFCSLSCSAVYLHCIFVNMVCICLLSLCVCPLGLSLSYFDVL